MPTSMESVPVGTVWVAGDGDAAGRVAVSDAGSGAAADALILAILR
jgi:hypothetical protein